LDMFEKASAVNRRFEFHQPIRSSSFIRAG